MKASKILTATVLILLFFVSFSCSDESEIVLPENETSNESFATDNGGVIEEDI